MIKHSSLLLVLEKPWIHNNWETLPAYQNIFIKLPTTMLSKVLYRYQPRSLYNSFVQFTCTIHLYSSLVRFICTIHMYKLLVLFICTNHLYNSHVQLKTSKHNCTRKKYFNWGITKQLYETLCKSVSSETCTASNQDIAFIIDGSSSIHRKDYEKVKKWITTIVEGLEIGQGKILNTPHRRILVNFWRMGPYLNR